MSVILVPISHGELLDKITILRIKAKRIDDRGKVANVLHELSMLEMIWKRSVPLNSSVLVQADERELEAVNESLWETVEDIHRCETARRFDEHFMTLARRVCTDNDKRAAIKKRINKLLGSQLIEEKSHQ
jgi:hypothetical protein